MSERDPHELVAVENNTVDELRKARKAIRRLKRKNVSANTLEEFAQDAGTIVGEIIVVNNEGVAQAVNGNDGDIFFLTDTATDVTDYFLLSRTFPNLSTVTKSVTIEVADGEQLIWTWITPVSLMPLLLDKAWLMEFYFNLSRLPVGDTRFTIYVAVRDAGGSENVLEEIAVFNEGLTDEVQKFKLSHNFLEGDLAINVDDRLVFYIVGQTDEVTDIDLTVSFGSSDCPSFIQLANFAREETGTGDVIGDTVSVTDHLAIFSDETGKHIKESGYSVEGIFKEIGDVLFLDSYLSVVGRVLKRRFINDPNTITTSLDNSGDQVFGEFLSEPIGTGLIPTGVYGLSFYLSSSSTITFNSVTINIYSRTPGGSETLLAGFNPTDRMGAITTTPEQTTIYGNIADSVSVNPDDSILVRFQINKTTGGTIDINIHVNDPDYPSYIKHPYIPFPDEQIKILGDSVDYTTDTLADVDDLFADVVSGETYIFKAVLIVIPDATGGFQASIAGTCTAIAVTFFDMQYQQGQDVLGNPVASFAGSSDPVMVIIEGTIIVDDGGTLVVQAAQNNASGTTTLYTLSSFTVKRVVV